MGPSDATASLKLSAPCPLWDAAAAQLPEDRAHGRLVVLVAVGLRLRGVDAPAPIVLLSSCPLPRSKGRRDSGTTVKAQKAPGRWCHGRSCDLLCPARLTKLPAGHPVNAQAKQITVSVRSAKKSAGRAPIQGLPGGCPVAARRAPLPKTRSPPRNKTPSTAAQILGARRPGGSPITPHARRRHETPPPARETAPKN